MGVRRRERTPCGRKSAERWPECFVTRNQTQRNEQVSEMVRNVVQDGASSKKSERFVLKCHCNGEVRVVEMQT